MAAHRPLCPQGQAIQSQDIVTSSDTLCAEHQRPFVLLATILASAMAFIDGSVISIALPVLGKDLSASFFHLQWINHAYTLFVGALILVGGSAGDRLGRRKVFLAGTIIFTLASILCGLAPSAEFLIGARAAQGIGAALMVPQSLAIISASFPKEIRGRAIGTWAAASAITTALGPTVGGLLIDEFSWRAIFWLNVPLAVVVVYFSLRAVPESRDETNTGPIDIIGASMVTLASGILTYGLTLLTEDLNQAHALFFIVAGGVGLVLFVIVEMRSQNPVMPPRLFLNRAFSGANLMTLFLYGALSGSLFLVPFELIGHRGLSATEAGLVFLPFGLIIGVLSRFSGGLADRYGARILLVAGSFLTGLSLVVLGFNWPELSLGIVLPISTMAFGMALVVSPLTTVVMNSVATEQSGTASGVNNAASRLAGLFAIAIVGGLSGQIYTRALQGIERELPRFGDFPGAKDLLILDVSAAFQSAYTAGMWLMAGFAFFAGFVAFVTLSNKAKP